METGTETLDQASAGYSANAVGSSASQSFTYHRNATFLSLLVGYAGYYLCRQNLSVAMGPMKLALGLDARQFGQMMSLGTLAYTFGKLTTGALADAKGQGRTVFYVGLIGTVVSSLVFSLGSSFGFLLAMWSLNRLCQSMGWGGLVNVMSRWFSTSTYGTAMGLMSMSYQFGTVIASVFAGFLLSMGFGWQALFTVPAFTLFGIGMLTYPFLKNSPNDVGHELPGYSIDLVTTVHEPEAILSYWQRFSVLLKNRGFLMMAALSFVLTFMREVFNLWMPSYFSEMGASASMAAFKSAIFPVLGCVGTLFAGWYSDRFLQSRRGPIMAVLLGGLALSFFGLSQVTTIATLTGISTQKLAVVFVGLVGFFLLGPYSFVGGVAALDFGGRKTAGTAAGLLDGVGYFGATLSGIGVAEVLMRAGWHQLYAVMAVLSIAAILLCVALWRLKPQSEQ
jgi:OPA family glycerol-3-phosphate transporter-like MFS transporter